MLDLWTTATLWFNLPLTVLLIAVIAYWLLVIMGALDIHLFDVDHDLDAGGDIDVQADVDLDADMDMDANGDLHGAADGVGWLTHFFSFLNIGTVPMMVVLSIFVLSLWVCAMVTTHYASFGNTWVALVWYIPCLIAAIFVTKLATTPFAWLFRRINSEGLANARGQLCTLLSDNDGQRLSQGEVKLDGAPLLINVKARAGHHLTKGDRALIIEKDPIHNYYFVEKFDDWED